MCNEHDQADVAGKQPDSADADAQAHVEATSELGSHWGQSHTTPLGITTTLREGTHGEKPDAKTEAEMTRIMHATIDAARAADLPVLIIAHNDKTGASYTRVGSMSPGHLYEIAENELLRAVLEEVADKDPELEQALTIIQNGRPRSDFRSEPDEGKVEV